VKALIAAEIGRPWAEIDAAMYTDVIDRQPLLEFAGYPDAESLLSRYNLAQLQACLYKAQRLSVRARADFAAIVRYAKLSRLLVDTSRVSDSGLYRVDLSGPASVLHETRRYGVNFARFVSALVACRGWEMTADVATPWSWTAKLQLASTSGYRSHVPSPAEFDSEVEARLAQKWGESCNGWLLIRDAGILQQCKVTFVPDFLLKHEDGREAWLEIVGFWTPEYLESKRKTLSAFSGRRMVLAVSERTAKQPVGGRGVIIYKSAIKREEVVAAVEQLDHVRHER
jgi:predicted nuclease of restriction endonuclease-like RecB superfamily